MIFKLLQWDGDVIWLSFAQHLRRLVRSSQHNMIVS